MSLLSKGMQWFQYKRTNKDYKFNYLNLFLSFWVFKQDGTISILHGKPLKLD